MNNYPPIIRTAVAAVCYQCYQAGTRVDLLPAAQALVLAQATYNVRGTYKELLFMQLWQAKQRQATTTDKN